MLLLRSRFPERLLFAIVHCRNTLRVVHVEQIGSRLLHSRSRASLRCALDHQLGEVIEDILSLIGVPASASWRCASMSKASGRLGRCPEPATAVPFCVVYDTVTV